MKKSGFKTKSGFAKKSGFTKKRKHTPKNKIREKSKDSPLWRQIKKTDTVFSILVRLRSTDETGMVKCYTCDYKAFWSREGIECGHYISRANLGTRWSDVNCKPQCHHCNTVLGGNLKIFEANLIRDYGKKVVQELNQLAQKVVRLKVEQVREIRLNLNKVLREIKTEKGI